MQIKLRRDELFLIKVKCRAIPVELMRNKENKEGNEDAGEQPLSLRNCNMEISGDSGCT